MKQSTRQLKKYMTGICIMAIWLLILLFMDIPVFAAKEHPDRLRIPFPETEGFTMTDENGKRTGLVVDYLYEIAKYTGWTYEFIDTDAEGMVQDFIDGRYDLMGGTYYSKAFEKYFAYPDYSCGNTKAVLLARQDNDAIKGYDLRDLDGTTIGVVKQAADNVRRLEEFLAANGLACTIKPYTSQEAAANQLNLDLEAGEIDLKLGNATDDTGEFRSVAYFDAQPHYLVTQPDNKELLDQLNWAMEHILLSDPHFTEEVYERYFNDTGVENVLLTPQEKAYIQQ